MRKFVIAAVVATLAAQPMIVPSFAFAKGDGYGKGDPCSVAKHKSADKGTTTGAIIGAIGGAAVAGKGDRGKGAVIGGALGAVAGHQVGLHNFNCTRYPSRFAARKGCHWIDENGRGFEICRGRDGEWRRSGRA
ncbi:hypothetical protein BH11PSE2_BH11PSE2_19580 [soil metagenome]